MKIIIGILALSFIVFFHELGHFIFAKFFGVKVLAFSIGMGPIILHKTIKGTDYRLSLLPFGGYCSMEGEQDFQKAIDENMKEIPKTPTSLYGVHPFKRILIVFAGPFFNFLIGIICFTIISMVGYQYSSFSNEIVIPDETYESPARQAGLKTGDKILFINGKKIENFRSIQQEVSLSPKKNLNIEIERGNQILDYQIKTIMNKETGSGILGVFPNVDSLAVFDVPTYSFFPAIWHGITETIDFTKLTVKSIGILFSGVNITNVVAGPARVTTIMGETLTESFKDDFRIGLYSTLSVIALISISLGFMNLLPIPVLDGGLILFGLIELFFKKQIPPKVQVKVQYFGIAIIACLFILGITGDIRYFIQNWRTK